jgi:double-stranded uracil-DNA glycosylase
VIALSTGDILPDVLAPNLKLVICGSAVGAESARAGSYYAGRNNMFWQILHATGLTDRLLHTSEYSELLHYGIGLTDAAKKASGVDANIPKEDYDAASLVQKMLFYQPRIICFNGKKAAAALCTWQRQRNCRTEEFGYGIYPHPIMENGPTIFVAPSTSAAAKRYWLPDYWYNLAALFQRLT